MFSLLLKDLISDFYLRIPVVRATDRSNAMALVLFLFCGALWFLLQGVSCLAFCSRVYFSPFSIVIISFGEERAGLCVSSAFVCLFCTH